ASAAQGRAREARSGICQAGRYADASTEAQRSTEPALRQAEGWPAAALASYGADDRLLRLVSRHRSRMLCTRLGVRCRSDCLIGMLRDGCLGLSAFSCVDCKGTGRQLVSVA